MVLETELARLIIATARYLIDSTVTAALRGLHLYQVFLKQWPQ